MKRTVIAVEKSEREIQEEIARVRASAKQTADELVVRIVGVSPRQRAEEIFKAQGFWLREDEATLYNVELLRAQIAQHVAKRQPCPTCEGRPGHKICSDCGGTGKFERDLTV